MDNIADYLDLLAVIESPTWSGSTTKAKAEAAAAAIYDTMTLREKLLVQHYLSAAHVNAPGGFKHFRIQNAARERRNHIVLEYTPNV